MSGHLGNLSPKQEQALKRLKENTSDVHKPSYDDYFYLRWLRARNFDVGHAETMLRKHLLFRRKIGADTILEDYTPPELIDHHYPRGFIGVDKEGCPVRYMPFSNLDLKGFVHTVKKTEILKFLTYIFEHDIKVMKDQSKKLGKEIEKHSYIIDLEGYTFRQATNKDAVDMLNEVLHLYEANYPERMKTAYFIHAPHYFSIVLALSKPFLSEATINKFKVYGNEGFQQELLKIVDADVLPQFLGGNRTDPDGNPRCLSIINYGEMIPKSRYFKKDKNSQKFPEEEGVEKISLDKRAFHLVEIPVEKVGTKLQWEFESTHNDVGVGLYKRKTEQELQEILPIERVNCHLVPESCVYVCEDSGTYILKFDNTYSWFSQKKIFYRITIIQPEEAEKEH